MTNIKKSASSSSDSGSDKQSEIAYLRFKEALMSGNLELGAVITQAELVKVIGISMSPLRVALNKLESEGLVEILSRSGVQIIKPDLTLIRNCFQIREMIEQQAIRSFVRTAQDRCIEELIEKTEALVDKIAIVRVDESLIREFFDLDSYTHNQFVDALDNPMIKSIYKMNEERIALIRLDAKNSPTSVLLKETFIEHMLFLKAIQHRDLEAALEHLESHMSNSMKRAMGM